VSVIDDKKRGLVAQLEANGTGEDAISNVLGAFTRPWEFAEES
jgi:fatty-acyl-CoA synthase/long-chain acyl-CoA synthetase